MIIRSPTWLRTGTGITAEAIILQQIEGFSKQIFLGNGCCFITAVRAVTIKNQRDKTRVVS